MLMFDFFLGPFEKFTRVTMILPLTGPQYSEKVSENCVAIWKALGIYTDAEEKAIEKFIEVFKDQNFPPGSSILFTQSPTGSLKASKFMLSSTVLKFLLRCFPHKNSNSTFIDTIFLSNKFTF